MSFVFPDNHRFSNNSCLKVSLSWSTTLTFLNDKIVTNYGKKRRESNCIRGWPEKFLTSTWRWQHSLIKASEFRCSSVDNSYSPKFQPFWTLSCYVTVVWVSWVQNRVSSCHWIFVFERQYAFQNQRWVGFCIWGLCTIIYHSDILSSWI